MKKIMKLVKKIINKLFKKKLYHPNVRVDITGGIKFDDLDNGEPLSFSFME